jgi:hypothetical protein
MSLRFSHIPSPDTLSSIALEDVYQALRTALKTKLQSVNAIGLMFDGWTDRYKARPYMGVRIAFLDDWDFKMTTLGCHVLPSHTSRAIADHISALLRDYFPDPKKLMIFCCHDGAANMLKTSKLLKANSIQHCSSHALHLLLTVDSLNKLDEVTAILTKCRNIVTALHFKTLLVEDELASTHDKELVLKLQKRLAEVNNLLELDEQFVDEIPVDKEDEEDDMPQRSHHSHRSLKGSTPTRWNSTLYMIESIVDLEREVENALKRDGQRELCLHADELDFLKELIAFLTHFKLFTDFVGASQPVLSIVPLLKMKIRKLCITSPDEDTKITAIKAAVLAKLDHRFPDSDRIKLHQLLDPQTKNMMPRAMAATLLEGAIKDAITRRHIAVSEVPPLAAAATSVDDGSEDLAEKRKRLRLEMLREFRSEMQCATEENEIESTVSVTTSSTTNCSNTTAINHLAKLYNVHHSSNSYCSNCTIISKQKLYH